MGVKALLVFEINANSSTNLERNIWIARSSFTRQARPGPSIAYSPLGSLVLLVVSLSLLKRC